MALRLDSMSQNSDESYCHRDSFVVITFPRALFQSQIVNLPHQREVPMGS